jgi:hypothetical protein
MKRGSAALAAVLIITAPSALHAQASRLDECRREAREISGYDGEATQSFLKGAVRGGLGGAAIGAAGGWVTDSNASKTAKRGAALGALIGGVRAASRNKKIEDQRRTYDRALESCLSRDSD